MHIRLEAIILVTGTWGANTFPMHKQLSNHHFQNPQTFFFLVFLAFSSNKCWWRLHAFFFVGRCTIESHVTLLSKGRLRQLTTPLETVRELGHSVSVQCFYHDFFFIYFPFYLLCCSYLYITFVVLLSWCVFVGVDN